MSATKRDFILSSGIGVSADNFFAVNVTNSSTTSTGSIITSGGAGIAKSVSIGGRLQLFNGSNYTAFISSASGNSAYILPSSTPATGTSVLQSDSIGNLSWVPMTATGSGAASGFTTLNSLTSEIQYFSSGTTGSGFNISSSGSTHTFNIPIAGSGSTGLITTLAQTIAGQKTFTSTIIGDLSGVATTATSVNVVLAASNGNHPLLFTPTSGTASGVAVSSNSTLVYNAVSDILSVSGLAITSSTASLSNSTGALIISGGVGIGGSLNAGTSIAVDTGVFGLSLQRAAAGSLGAIYSTGIVPSSSNYSFATDGTNLNLNSTSNIYLNISNNNKATLSTNNFSIGINVASNSASTGALTVTGGVGIGQSVSIGGRLQLFNGSNYTAFVSSASGNTVYTLPATSPATGSSVLQSTAAGVLSWVPMVATSSSSGDTSQNIVINSAGNANVFHPVLFTPSSLSAGSAVSSDSTISFNPSTEILNVSGLAITSGTASTNTTTGALVVRGGLGVTGQLSFATASFGFTGITTNPTMSFIGATSASPITLTVLTDNSLSWEGTSGQLFAIDNNLTSGDIFSVSDISGLPIINASAGQTVNINEFGGFTQIGNGSINSLSTTTGSLVVSGGLGVTGNANIGGTVRLTNTTPSTSSTTGAMTVSGGVGIGGSASISGRLQLFNSSNYTAFVSSATGNTVYTLPATSPAIGTSYLTSNSSGVMAWTAPNKANYVLSFGAGFTPTADSADSVSLNIPFAPDGTTKYYYVKRIDYRNETLSGGTGLSFYLQRHTSGDASWSTTNVITAGSGASFYVGAGTYSTSFTTIASSAGVAGSIISGNYVRLYFTGVGSAANLSLAMIIEEQ